MRQSSILFGCCISTAAALFAAKGQETVSQHGISLDIGSSFVVNTWPFSVATTAAATSLREGGDVVSAVEAGVNACEMAQCDGTVGFGGSPDEYGNVYLDALIIDGATQQQGAVLNLPNVKRAISVARSVMEHTEHTILTGHHAGQFASEMGHKVEKLETKHSHELWKNWKSKSCQPNYRYDVLPNPRRNCGPYKPSPNKGNERSTKREGHDTIGLIAAHRGNMAAGTSTNGMTHKVPGRVADSAVPGAGAFIENSVGACVATGDGDTLVKFAPCAYTIFAMQQGVDPTVATARALDRIEKYYPDFSGALVAATPDGKVGAACYGFTNFEVSWQRTNDGNPNISPVVCRQKGDAVYLSNEL